MAAGHLLNKQNLLTFSVLFLCLSACSQKPLLYNWGPYHSVSYQLLQQDAVEAQEQINLMEEHSRQVESKGEKLPPGYHAQLGMLYAQIGNMERMRAEFMREKELFPESTVYMDFLLAEGKKPEKKSEK